MMTSTPLPSGKSAGDHQTWIHSRLLLDKAFQDALQHGFALIAAGFGSFAIFGGVAAIPSRDELPKSFALVMTVVGVIVILVAARHYQKMVDWVNTDEFGSGPAPTLPNERRPLFLAAGAVVIGLVSFVALLLLP